MNLRAPSHPDVAGLIAWWPRLFEEDHRRIADAELKARLLLEEMSKRVRVAAEQAATEGARDEAMLRILAETSARFPR